MTIEKASEVFECLGFNSYDSFCMALGWAQSVDYYCVGWYGVHGA